MNEMRKPAAAALTRQLAEVRAEMLAALGWHTADTPGGTLSAAYGRHML